MKDTPKSWFSNKNILRRYIKKPKRFSIRKDLEEQKCFEIGKQPNDL